ncbi:MAG: hypothetical protein WD733_09550 [Bryobacterales bacterium]
MDLRTLRLLGLAFLFSLASAAAGAPPSWTFEQMEQFLARADVVESRPVVEGVTRTVRATLRQDGVTHDAQIQQVDISKPTYPTANGWESNFRDYWGYNVAAYRLSRMLELGRLPVSVRREVDGKPAAVTWWIDDVLMTEKTRFTSNLKPPDVTAWNRQMYTVRVFDQLIHNTDRNLANLVITRDWKIWMIDHTRAFRLNEDLGNPKHLGLCERKLLDALRKLDRRSLAREMGEYLTGAEVDALLSRRDKIVDYFDRQVAERGEQEVLFDGREP